MSSEKPPREYVESLLSKGSYKTSNQSTLEAYVEAQAAGEGEYYFEANKALLKIYQFLPTKTDPSKVVLILLLGLLEYPSTDLLAFSYLVPERLQTAEPRVASVLECSRLLDSCKFAEFWEAFGKMDSGDDENLKALIGRSTAVLQRGILQVLALTYKSASLSKVLASLKLSSSDEVLKLKDPCIASIEGDTVTFVSTAENTKRNRVFRDGLSYGAIANMMAKVVVAE
mmetsp:Transcript_21175/g.39535  ORF Transcript_21175/g.39535 Transcript_21175/m.39535 type:complete len:228 (-) Transcript_21175:66-749(-)